MRILTATLCLTLAVLLGSVGMSECADFQKGKTAYESGDYPTALREFRTLAEQGNPNGQRWLGYLYIFGQGVPQDEKTAAKWFKLSNEQYKFAAEKGDAVAQHALGETYRYGIGVSSNYKTAVRWYRLAAKQGHAKSQYDLGCIFEKAMSRDDFPRNYKTAVRWYRLAAKQGHAKSQYNLGTMYRKGRGVPQDYKTAVKWYRLAANQGLADAMAGLGKVFEDGLGVPKNYKTAVRWYRLAAKQGLLGADFQADRLERQIAEQISIPPSKSAAELENERLRKEIARLKKQNQSKPEQVAKKPPPKKSPQPKSGSTGSGFFVSKLGHILTNEHVVRQCGSVTVGDNANKQVSASVLETDKRNDLALLRISSTKMASAETKSLISKLNVQKLGLKLVPLASGGLMRSDDIELGEKVLVSGFPYGELYSNTIKVTGGMVSAVKGMGDDSAQFQMDAAVQPGNSGGPIYDENGNIVGVVIAQLNKLKVAKAIGSIPENVNFGIKASTVRQFLTSAGLPTKWSNRTERKSTKELAQIAKNQTVMVVCNP